MLSDSEISASFATGKVSAPCVVGGMIGMADDGCQVNECYATGKVTGDLYVGGLLGAASSTGTLVQNCYASGVVSGNDSVGGLIGCLEDGSVNLSYATGAVSGDYYMGGLVGACYTTDDSVDTSVTILACHATNKVTGENVVGGLVGYSENALVSRSFATGQVRGTNMVGGLVGWQGQDGEILNSYARGAVSGNLKVAGFLGMQFGRVSYSYSTGKVTGNKLFSGGFGFAQNESDTEDCFWDIQTSGYTTSRSGEGLSTAEMKTGTTFTDAGWDLTHIWGINPAKNDGYPYLNPPDALAYSPLDVKKLAQDELKKAIAAAAAKEAAVANKLASSTSDTTVAAKASAKSAGKNTKDDAAKTGENTTADVTHVLVSTGTLKADLQAKRYTLVETPTGFAAALTVANVGNANAGAFHVGLYFWTGASASLSDAILVQEKPVLGLAAGEETTVLFYFHMPDFGKGVVVLDPVFAIDNHQEVAVFDAAKLVNVDPVAAIRP
jgi:hypothetical protein